MVCAKGSVCIAGLRAHGGDTRCFQPEPALHDSWVMFSSGATGQGGWEAFVDDDHERKSP